MSHHVLHLQTPGVVLSCAQGFLFCRYSDGQNNKLPLADIRTLIIATYQVSFSNTCLARLLENNCVILHCNDHYQPVGWSAGLEHMVQTKAFFQQISRPVKFEQELWDKLLRCKIQNQIGLLQQGGADCTEIRQLAQKQPPSESLIAKKYWRLYFQILRRPTRREHRHAKSFENIALNYGYAVVSSLLQRAILVHGLLPGLGIHHKARPGNMPLIYDLLEPFRAFVDRCLSQFCQTRRQEYIEHDLRAWNKYFGEYLQDCRLPARGLSYKLLDFIDIYVTDIAVAFENLDCAKIHLPNIDTLGK
ncbi:CRISPR-associated protein Cas1 [Candidatus Termititenax persephonae]|uniref:CRISPR-associated protein Cas1 n=1 Tax=Candidatus Termititenax persephonae TaxID=2218525 RepID=A0A388TIZ5_9BACT|nr:CRISPR-associated protein Cas1 [Candidatus Termititenax persephonae]